VALLFAAFLGYNPMKTLLGPKLTSLSSSAQANVTGRSFFPHLISGPFMHGLRIAFTMSIAMCLVAAACSALRGSTEVATDDEEDLDLEDGTGDPMRDRLTAVAETEAESIPL
jgi:hypothetical protein